MQARTHAHEISVCTFTCHLRLYYVTSCCDDRLGCSDVRIVGSDAERWRQTGQCLPGRQDKESRPWWPLCPLEVSPVSSALNTCYSATDTQTCKLQALVYDILHWRKVTGKRCSECGKLVNSHTPSTAFRHLPPNSARFGYATEGALFISAQLSTDAVSALRKVRILIWL